MTDPLTETTPTQGGHTDGHCACVSMMNAQLASSEYNGLLVTTLFGLPPKVSIEVMKLDPKSRKKPPRVIASFCPFCGESYARAQGGAA